VRPTGRGAIGVGGIDVDNNEDEVVGMICVNPSTPDRTVLVISEKGYGKRTAVDEYRITNRGGKGVKTINVTGKTGRLVGIMDVAEKEDMLITCKSGITIRMKIADISVQGRATQGVKLIRIDEGDEIAAITKIDVPDEIEVSAETEENNETTNSGEAASEESGVQS
jgi:DNA gyrase subunit A